MKINIILLCLTGFLLRASAQTAMRTGALIIPGLNAYSTTQADLFSCKNNPAALVKVKRLGAGIYGEQRFFLASVRFCAMTVAIPTSLGNVGVNLFYSGFKNFQQQQLGIAYAKSVGKKLDIGIQFNYFSYKIPAYGGKSNFDVELAVQFHLSPQLNLGLHVYNPAGGMVSKKEQKLLPVIKAGVGYDVSEHFFCGIEMVKEQALPVSINAGMQYNFSQQFFALTGFTSSNASFYAGAGTLFHQMQLNMHISYHPQLGITPALLFMISL